MNQNATHCRYCGESLDNPLDEARGHHRACGDGGVDK